ncbi:MAG: hypothetical protein LW629_09175 [Burkholderiales bacterium]|nr:hypothetical protein [Burkholderiales bacterium]
MNTVNTQKHQSQAAQAKTSDASKAATAGTTAPMRLSASSEKITPVKPETQEDLLSGNDAPEDFVTIVELDRDTTALVQEEFGLEESNENLSSLFGGATPSYGLAALGLGGAMAGMPGKNDGNVQQAMSATTGSEEPQSSGDASPFGPLLAALNNARDGAPEIPAAPTQADGSSAPDASDNTDANTDTATPSRNAGLNDLLPLLEIASNAISSQAATTEATPLMSQPPALF